MEFGKLYYKYMPLWPESIDLSDSHPLLDDGYMFSALNGIYQELEKKTIEINDAWGLLFLWSCYQAFHCQAKINIGEGIKILDTRKVDKKIIDKNIQSNMCEETWKDDKKNYVPYRGD